MLDHVVVLGAGLAGLTAARAVAPHAHAVTLVERDRLPDAPVPRPGVPQARHAHALLTRGARELEAAFPGLLAELVAAGGHEVDWATQRIRSIAGWSPRYVSGLRSVCCSRDLLEFTVRRRVMDLPGVSVVDGLVADGLTGGAGRVTGVLLRERGAPRDVGERTAAGGRSGAGGRTAVGGHRILAADLVIDATGRGSAAPQWLEALGAIAPTETVVASHLGYASRVYRMPEGFAADWRLLAVRCPPPSSQAVALYPVEGQRWYVTATGQGDETPPHDAQAFAAFLARAEGVADALAGATPVGRVTAYRRTENRWRHWERLREWPDGLVVVGDAACAFNPAYGQGMTVAAIQAALLGGELARGPWRAGSARRAQRRLARVLRDPWVFATQEDFRLPGTAGRPGRATRLVHAYTDRVLRVAVHDAAVSKRFFEVSQLVKPATALAAPAIVGRLLRPVPEPGQPPVRRR